MTLLADLLSTVFERRTRWGRGATDDRPFDALTADLMGRRGEGAGLVVAQTILERYVSCDDDGKLGFFRHLAEDMAIDPAAVQRALDAYRQGQSKARYRALMAASEPPRQDLIRRLNQVPGATRALVAMRADLLRLGRGDAPLEALDLDFRHLFASWFNRGFLVLRPINWQSPAHILEKIIAYEAVHAIDSWADLRRRVEPPDRRCFAFFHPTMPDEPLIFVEVALTTGIAGSVQTLLSEDRAALASEDADTAIFYSISNCQAGLANISFGNSLIKQVASDLAMEFPGLARFATLSPIPGFMAWLEAERPGADQGDSDRMLALAARYLVTARRGDGQPQDPVARFHLGNGAEIHKLHANGDLSLKGRSQSGGIMVNYLYDFDRVAANQERFAAEQVIAASGEIRALSAAADPADD